MIWVQNWAQIQGVPEIEGDVRRLDFWTTLGHPGYLEPIRQIWVIWGKSGPFGSFVVRFPNPLAPGSDIQIHVSWGTRLG